MANERKPCMWVIVSMRRKLKQVSGWTTNEQPELSQGEKQSTIDQFEEK